MNVYVAVAALVPAAYQLLAIAACVKRMGFRQKLTGFTPPVSILKPVRGVDDAETFVRAIQSQAAIDYPEYEILFGIRDESDPAVPFIRQLQTDNNRVRIVWTTTETLNGKVGSLIDLERAARYDYLVISDADIRVPRDYLTKVIAPLEDPSVGLTTCLYRAHGGSFVARLEGLGIETDFAPSALVAPSVGVDEFAFGSTIAVRRGDLARSGGLGPISDFIADDYQIGRRIHDLGLKCVLAETVVDTHLSGATVAEVWRHQVRWARTIRASRPGGFMGLFVTFATFWAVLIGLAGEPWIALGVLLVRMAAAGIASRGVLKSDGWRMLDLVPLRDLLGVGVWIAGLLPGSVEWRGRRMFLTSEGRIIP